VRNFEYHLACTAGSGERDILVLFNQFWEEYGEYIWAAYFGSVAWGMGSSDEMSLSKGNIYWKGVVIVKLKIA
jgi:hypothetical protein